LRCRRDHCPANISFPGGRRFHFIDPGGNELAVWSTDEAGGNEAGA
jgi:hypothetical protein